MRLFVVLMGLLLLPGGVLQASRNTTPARITWGIPEWAPFSAAPGDGPNKNAVINNLLQMLIKEMPEYQHDLIDSSVPKAMELWRQGKALCSPITLYTKQRADLAYMTQFVLVPPLEIVMRADRFTDVSGYKELNLEKLVQEGRWKGLFVRDRSYGPPVDETLRKHFGSSAIEVSPPQGTWLSVMKMVAGGRADYTVEYPPVVSEYNRTNQGAQLFTMPIAGYMKPFSFMIACTKNAEGKATLGKIEAQLTRLAKRSDFQKEMFKIFGDDSTKKYQKEIQDFFERRSKGTWAP